MAKIRLARQNKKTLKPAGHLLVDLHFHLGKRKPLRTVLQNLADAVDVVTLTDRGDRFKNDFEYDFDSFRRALEEQRISYSGNDTWIKLDAFDLAVIRSQEIFVAEGYDIIVIGLAKDIPDDISCQDLVEESENAITMLSSPFLIPNSLKIRAANDKTALLLALQLDCIEIYNQNLIIGNANRYAEELARKADKPGIAASDLHSYAKYNYPLNLSGIIIADDPSMDMLQLIKREILGKRFSRYEVFSPFAILEFMGLTPAEMKGLYHGRQQGSYHRSDRLVGSKPNIDAS